MLLSKTPKPSRLLALALAAIFVVSAEAAQSQSNQNDPERQRAFELYRNGKFAEAVPLFEKLAKANPWDRDVIELLGYLVLGQAVYAPDAAARKAARVRGRELLLRAQQLGSESPLLKSTLSTVPPDGGGDVSFSAQKEVDDAMREGEAAFANHEYEKAIQSYQHALLFDPKQYEATLFTGDAYFQTNNPTAAGEWYARAIAIDPNRETAYRYWGDVLMRQGKMTEAREKLIEAYVCDPYSRLTQATLVNWASRNNVEVSHPEVEIPNGVVDMIGSGQQVNMDWTALQNEKDPRTAAWLRYALVRMNWGKTNFAKEYPQEKTYRHSLKEEATALRAAIQAVEGNKQRDEQKLDASLQNLVKLEHDGLLEPFILLAMPDAGIARDFLGYRAANVDKLRKYVLTYVVKETK